MGRIEDRPRSIARGVALGTFVAMTPTVGIQMLLVTVINTLCRANVLAGLIMVYISNPLTMIPLYWLDYVLGALLCGKPLISYHVFAQRMSTVTAHVGRWEFWSATVELFKFGADLAWPTLLGGVCVGAACAVPAYFLTLGFLARRAAARRRSVGRSGS